MSAKLPALLITSGVLVITARHCQALDHLYRREFGPAEEGWLALLALQEKDEGKLAAAGTR